MRYEFSLVTDIEAFFLESDQLLQDHKDEVDLFSLDLDPDLDSYRQSFKDGTFFLLQMRSESKLVGYAGFFIYTSLHHKTSLHAKQDILFIRKDYRGHGVKFIRYCDIVLKQIGVNVVLQCVPTSNDWSPILDRIGYTKIETVYTKEL